MLFGVFFFHFMEILDSYYNDLKFVRYGDTLQTDYNMFRIKNGLFKWNKTPNLKLTTYFLLKEKVPETSTKY